MERTKPLLTRLLEQVDQTDLKQIELTKILADHIESYWIAAKEIKRDGQSIATENGGLKQHPSIATKNAASKCAAEICKTLGLKKQTIVESKKKSVKDLMD